MNRYYLFLFRPTIGYLASLSLIFLGACSAPSSQGEEATSKPPNVLFIISDDQGWTDYGFMDHPFIETPRLDQLARESLTFTRGYVTAPLCSPSLASMMSGLYPHQHGVTGNDPSFPYEGKRYGNEWRVERLTHFQPILAQYYSHPILTQLLKEKNYAMLQTGKWWLGSWEDAHFTAGMTHGDPLRGGRHGDEGLTIGREGLAQIDSFLDSAQQKDQPFFIWYAPFLPHSPHTPPEALEQKYLPLAPTAAVARYWAMVEWFDKSCGSLLDMLDEREMTENTLVVYVCDNGWIQDPERPNRYAHRSKQTPYEMGTRTPMMYKWPAHIQPEMDTTTFVSSLDMVPTVLAAIGKGDNLELPGINMLNDSLRQARQAVFSEDYAHDIADVQAPTRSLEHRVIWSEEWKLILPDSANVPEGKAELYAIFEDPHEEYDLAADYPEVVARLTNELKQWWKPAHRE